MLIKLKGNVEVFDCHANNHPQEKQESKFRIIR
jgi:hypothetical protein